MSSVIPANGNSKNAKRAFVNATASGNTSLVPTTGLGPRSRIRVLAMVLTTTAENVIKFQSATTDIFPAMPVVALGGMVLPFAEHGWFECAVFEALNFNQTVATATAVHIVYTIVD